MLCQLYQAVCVFKTVKQEQGDASKILNVLMFKKGLCRNVIPAYLPQQLSESLTASTLNLVLITTPRALT